MELVDTDYILYKAYLYLMRYIRSGEMHNKIKAIEMIKDIQRIFWGSARRALLDGGIIPGNVDIYLSSEPVLSQGGGKSRRRHSRSRRRRPSRPSRPSRRRRPSCRKMRGPISRGANKKSRKGCKSRKLRRRVRL